MAYGTKIDLTAPGDYVGYAALTVWVIGTEISRREPCTVRVRRIEGGIVHAQVMPGLRLVAIRRGFATVRVFTTLHGGEWFFEGATPRLYRCNDVLHIVP